MTYSILPAGEAPWRQSGQALSAQLGASARFWRLRPGQSVTGAGDEFYVVLEGEGSIRIGSESFTLPRLSSAQVSAGEEREIFNDGEQETLWLVVTGSISPATTKPTG